MAMVIKSSGGDEINAPSDKDVGLYLPRDENWCQKGHVYKGAPSEWPTNDILRRSLGDRIVNLN